MFVSGDVGMGEIGLSFILVETPRKRGLGEEEYCGGGGGGTIIG